MDPRRLFGNKAESRAAKFLQRQGLKIIARQYKTKIGEIDLIAQDSDEIVFVEVKARRTAEFGHPEEAVTQNKLRKIQAVAAEYLQEKKLFDAPHRIDVVSITGDEIMHLKAVE